MPLSAGLCGKFGVFTPRDIDSDRLPHSSHGTPSLIAKVPRINPGTVEPTALWRRNNSCTLAEQDRKMKIRPGVYENALVYNYGVTHE